MHLSASTVAQQITMSLKNVSLTKALSEIKSHSGYDFVIYTGTSLKNAKPVTISVKDAVLDKVLQQIFEDQPMSYQIQSKTIVIREKAIPRKTAIKESEAALLEEQQPIRGRVTNENGEPLAGATVYVLDAEGKRTPVLAIADRNGNFQLDNVQEGVMLEVTFLGYKPQTMRSKAQLGTVALQLFSEEVEIIDVFSTGYSSIPKERATGSFVELSKDVLEKRVTTNILDNIEGMAPGLQFDRRNGGANINIRGINTLSLEMMGPLIIVDNFPFSGDINSLNPLDIESVTLLKDAAAASIWGARAGNGVIVIKTKKSGRRGLTVEGNVNMRVGSETDLYYYPTISSSDFIDVERMLFENGSYNSQRDNNTTKQTIFSPVVELLYRHQEGNISTEDLEKTIESYRKLDYRNDLKDHFLRKPLLQQYQIAISGGNDLINQRMSLGYSKQLDGKIGNDQDKFNLSWNTNIAPTQRLQISTGLLYSYIKTHSGGSMNFPFSVGGGKSNLYPYAQLVGSHGKALAIPRSYNFNYVDTVSAEGMKDWKYYPLEEIEGTDANVIGQSLNANLSLKYSITDFLSFEGLYNIELNHTRNDMLRSERSFYVRDLFNRFGYLSDGKFLSQIPNGGMLDRSFSDLRSQRARAQITFGKKYGRHRLTLFSGTEISDQVTGSSSSRYYGYNDMMVPQDVDLTTSFPIFDGLGSSSTIPGFSSLGQLRNRFVSFYANGAYDYAGKYILTVSARRDASNLFGVRTNERWNPLWSTGLLWNVHEETFFTNIDWLNMLKVKGTYGHSGNSGGVASTLPIVQYITPASSALYKIKRAMVNTLPNESLKWEDVAMLNFGAEMGILNNRINFSFEYFLKKSTDLISDDPLDPTTGFLNMRRNVAEVRGKGFDMQLRTNNINRAFKWETTVMVSKATNKVEKFFGTESSSLQYVSYSGQHHTPMAEKMLYPVLSYRFMGLDPETGDPLGWADGGTSTDYSKLLQDSVGALIYHGTGLPVHHGSVQNSFSYGNFDLWVNVGFKFGHYFQRETVRYNDLFNSWIGHADYAKRWISPGDEYSTTVPSLIYPANSNRDDFYSFSQANIDRGDLVRLQDVRLNYTYRPKSTQKIKSLSIYLTASNLGIIWKSTKSTIDPDYMGSPLSRTYALGLKLSM